jgi:hypothetical protein
MAESVEDLTFNYTNEDGQLVRKQLDKEILSKGAWATIMYLYQDMDRRNNTYRVPKVSIVRYRKSNGVYRKQSSFNISSEKQGRHIVRVLENWYSTECAESPRDPSKKKPEAAAEKEGQAKPPKAEAAPMSPEATAPTPTPQPPTASPTE